VATPSFAKAAADGRPDRGADEGRARLQKQIPHQRSPKAGDRVRDDNDGAKTKAAGDSKGDGERRRGKSALRRRRGPSSLRSLGMTM